MAVKRLRKYVPRSLENFEYSPPERY